MSIEQELEALKEQEAALKTHREALMKKRFELLKKREAELIAAAGEVKQGDLVVIRADYGDARRNHLHLIEEVFTSQDRGDNDYPAVKIQYPGGGVSVCPLSNVVRVPNDSAAGLWLTIQDCQRELRKIVQETLHIYPHI